MQPGPPSGGAPPLATAGPFTYAPPVNTYAPPVSTYYAPPSQPLVGVQQYAPAYDQVAPPATRAQYDPNYHPGRGPPLVYPVGTPPDVHAHQLYNREAQHPQGQGQADEPEWMRQKWASGATARGPARGPFG